jgi:hypothetical protein
MSLSIRSRISSYKWCIIRKCHPEMIPGGTLRMGCRDFKLQALLLEIIRDSHSASCNLLTNFIDDADP